MFRQFNALDAPQLRLVEFYGGYRPRAFVASNGNSQAMKFIQPEILYCASNPIGQDDGLAAVRARSYSAMMAEAWAFAVGMEPVITRLG